MKQLPFLFIIEPIHTLDFANDASFLMMAEAKKRGHSVWIATADELRVSHDGSNPDAKPYVTVTEITWISGKDKKWKTGKASDLPLEKFPIILMRKDPPFSIDYVIATYILSLVDEKKSFILNNPAALRNFNEKMSVFHFPNYIPDTIVSKKYADLIHFLNKHKTIVLKPLERSSGQEVIVLNTKDKNRNSILEILTQKQTRYITAQKYLPAVSKGDKRIFVLNGEILGVYNRIGHPSDYRSNLHSGGTSFKATLNAKERSTCVHIAQVLKENGIYLAGLDMIGGFITEINITSPGGGFDVMNQGERVTMESKIIDFLEDKAKGYSAKRNSNLIGRPRLGTASSLSMTPLRFA